MNQKRVGQALLPASGDWHGIDVAWRLALIGSGTGLLAGPCQAACAKVPEFTHGTFMLPRD